MSESRQRSGSDTKVIMNNRKSYACLDIGSMGVDLKENFEKNKILTDTNQYPDNKLTEQQTSEGCGGEKSDEMCEKYVIEKPEGVKDEYEEEGDGKRDDREKVKSGDKKNGIEKLPPGWERHEDNGGCYFWHIKSGTIQREMPVWPKELKTPLIPPTSPIPSTDGNNPFSVAFNSLYNYGDSNQNGGTVLNGSSNIGNNGANSLTSVARSTSSHTLDLDQDNRKRKDLEYKRRSYPLKSETDNKPIRFAVRSLGWVEIAEEDLTPERSSKAVNKCILDLSFGKNDLLDVVGRWGDGKDLFLDLDEGALKLIDPENLTVLNTQPIHTIRVWGVGRDNGSDFAYVARDRLTRVHMCHVFRCETAARTIANTLRDICKKIMIERSVQLDGTNGPNVSKRAVRPTDLPTENRQRRMRHGKIKIKYPLFLNYKCSFLAQSFPTPMEEPKKVLRAQYLGFTEVHQAVGMTVLNDAIEKIISEVPSENWLSANVSISPSVIAIRPTGDDDQTVVEARVRYLSFLGIGKNVKNCAFIVHTAQDKFICHAFRCEPSSGALCKTIEAACKLRYQKCLDAHPANSRTSADSQSPNSKGIGETLKNIMNTLSFKKDGSSS
ncbi:protein Fe65 homolog isoform X3 [Chironomus tepperi]